MLIKEFTNSPKSTPESNLVTALELLRNRYKDSDADPKISTQSLINLVLNTDKTFDYDALVNANETNPAVKNLIKSFNKDQVVIRRSDSEEDSTTTNSPSGDATTQPVDTVGDMAKRAGKKRDSDIF